MILQNNSANNTTVTASHLFRAERTATICSLLGNSGHCWISAHDCCPLLLRAATSESIGKLANYEFVCSEYIWYLTAHHRIIQAFISVNFVAVMSFDVGEIMPRESKP